MAEITIERYTPARKPLWDDLVAASRNATFLLRRDYMDYHADRFADCSLIAMRGDRPLALLPANLRNGELYSHQGLTYGGWILPRHKVDGTDMLAIFDAWLAWCRTAGIRAIHYKPLPWIYALQPSQEDIYALWRNGFTQESVLLSSAVCLSHNPGFDYLRRRYLRRVAELGVTVRDDASLSDFWPVLEACLADRHDARPVHSLAEMERLQTLFPENILLRTVHDADGLQGGVVIYRTATTDHCQYIASTPRARAGRYLPYLFRHLIADSPGRYFDLGTSNEHGGRYLNPTLLANKFGYGATGVAYTQYYKCLSSGIPESL